MTTLRSTNVGKQRAHAQSQPTPVPTPVPITTNTRGAQSKAACRRSPKNVRAVSAKRRGASASRSTPSHCMPAGAARGHIIELSGVQDGCAKLTGLFPASYCSENSKQTNETPPTPPPRKLLLFRILSRNCPLFFFSWCSPCARPPLRCYYSPALGREDPVAGGERV